MPILQKQALLDLIAKRHPSGRVLQIGIAHGNTSKRLIKDGVNLHCADISHAYLINLLTDQPDTACLQLDITSLPYKNKSFDSIVCLEVLEHIPDYHSAIEEMSRILTLDGKLYVSVPTSHTEKLFKIFNPRWLEICQHVNIFRRDQLITALESHSLKVDENYNSNFVATFFWFFHTLIRTHHDATGKVDTNQWLTRLIDGFWKILTALRLYNIVNQVGTTFFPKSYIFVCRKSESS